MSSAYQRVTRVITWITWIIWLIWMVMFIIGRVTSSSIVKQISIISCKVFVVLGGIQLFMGIIKMRKEKKNLRNLKRAEEIIY